MVIKKNNKNILLSDNMKPNIGNFCWNNDITLTVLIIITLILLNLNIIIFLKFILVRKNNNFKTHLTGT